MLLSLSVESRLIDCEAAFARNLARELDGKAQRRLEVEGALAGNNRRLAIKRAEQSIQLLHAALHRLVEARHLLVEDGQNDGALLHQAGMVRPHVLNDGLGDGRQIGRHSATVVDGATDDAGAARSRARRCSA